MILKTGVLASQNHVENGNQSPNPAGFDGGYTSFCYPSFFFQPSFFWRGKNLLFLMKNLIFFSIEILHKPSFFMYISFFFLFYVQNLIFFIYSLLFPYFLCVSWFISSRLYLKSYAAIVFCFCFLKPLFHKTKFHSHLKFNDLGSSQRFV